MMKTSDAVFAGSVPSLYERHLVPLIFAPYADDLARRSRTHGGRRILELACGTGVVTRALAKTLSADVEIIATDLNPAMLEHAKSIAIERAVEWRQADAMNVPFADATFDVVVCQFGVMFFPDKAKAFAEARRVLDAGGLFLFNVWDRIEHNEVADVVTSALARLFPEHPPRFMARTPHGYHDVEVIRRDLIAAGFVAPVIETLAERSRAATAETAAIAFCQGTPLRDEITSIDPKDSTSLARATRAATTAIEERFGRGPIDAKIQAHVVTAAR